MRVFVILAVVLCLTGWVFAQDTVTREDHLRLAKSHAETQIALRQSQIQRLNDQMEIWKAQLRNINSELADIVEKRKQEEEKQEPKEKPKKVK